MSADVMDPDSPVPNLPSLAEVASEVTLHFAYPRSDVILRSRDSHNFYVSQLYIVNSSPVLRGIMQTVSNTSSIISGEAGEESESLPVVELPDRGETLHGLLTYIFPVVPILPSTSDEIMELLAAAQKYQMDSVLSHIRGAIARKDPAFIRPETAFHIYFLAQQHELREEVVKSARVTLRFPMVIEELVDKLNFPGMTGAYLHELWRYHEQVRSDLKTSVHEFKHSLPKVVKDLRCMTRSFNPSPSYSPLNHRTCTYPLWLDTYAESMADAPHLYDLISFENAWALHIQSKTQSYTTCSCLGMSSQLRRDFWEALTAFVDGVIERADSTLTLVKEEIPEKLDLSFVPLLLNVPDANIIVRSSDQVNFRIHKSVLAMSSTFFENLLSLPQPPDEELIDGLPVVQLSEDASVLSNLISLLYLTRRRVKPGSYEMVFALLAACQKYDMESIQLDIRDDVERGTFLAPDKAQAFNAYALASSHGLVPEMEHAARLTLGQPMTFESLGDGLRLFKGHALCELVRYRAQFR